MDLIKKSVWTYRFAFLLCLLASLFISWFYHDKFWWGPDDGHYGYVSQRILDGDLIHKDVQALHPGPIYFINAFFLNLAAGDMVGMRYPLIAMTVIQSGLAFMIARPKGMLAAIASAFALTAFGFIQFINPTANWYTLFLAILIAYVLTKFDAEQKRTVLLVGFLVGLTFLFRQLTGVFLALAVTVILFLKLSDETAENKPIAGSIVLAGLAIGLSFYLYVSAKPAGLILIGLSPVFILLLAALTSRVDIKIVISTLSWLTIGAVISILPLILYHGLQGNLALWFHDCFVMPFTFIEHGHLSEATFIALPYFGISELLAGNIGAIKGLIFWSSLLIAPLIIGINVLRTIISRTHLNSELPILASFFCLVAIHYEIPIYLLIPSGTALVGAMLTFQNARYRNFFGGFVILLGLSAIYHHAAQPLQRGLGPTAINQKMNVSYKPIPGTSIKVDKQEADLYAVLLNVIEKCTLPTDKIYAFPSHNEIYLLSNRDSAFRFIHSVHGLKSQHQVDETVKSILLSKTPSLIVHNTTDKYNTRFSDDLLERISLAYVKIEQVSPFAIYQRKQHSLASACATNGSEPESVIDR